MAPDVRKGLALPNADKRMGLRLRPGFSIETTQTAPLPQNLGGSPTEKETESTLITIQDLSFDTPLDS